MKIKTTQVNFYGVSHPITIDTQEMDEFLKKLVDKIDMRMIPEEVTGNTNPSSFYCSEPNVNKNDTGVTGTIIMFESHCSAHAFPEQEGFLSVIICSCKEYDVMATVDWIADYVDSERYIYESLHF